MDAAALCIGLLWKCSPGSGDDNDYSIDPKKTDFLYVILIVAESQ